MRTNWSTIYIKRPSLLAYVDGNLEPQITREIEMCELLRRHPHPNIAMYFGCDATDGRVSGLCFKRYPSTLLEAVNPRGLGKEGFLASGRELVTDELRKSLDGVMAGMKHLHSLGIVHNDINPANIMLDAGGTLVLIDFGSSRHIGESLGGTGAKRTYHWHDPGVEVALEKNDLDAFRELQVWLTGEVGDGFLFE